MANVLVTPIIAQNGTVSITLDADRSVDPEGSPRTFIVTPDMAGWTIYMPGTSGNSNPKPSIQGDEVTLINVGGDSFTVQMTDATDAVAVPGDYIVVGQDQSGGFRALYGGARF